MPAMLAGDIEDDQLGHGNVGGVGRVSLAPSTSNFSCSTNATGSNLPGTGRVLGNLYEYLGLLFEIAFCLIIHRAGFGPKETYQKIQGLRREEWETDERKSTLVFVCAFAISSIFKCDQYYSGLRMNRLCLNLLDFAVAKYISRIAI